MVHNFSPGPALLPPSVLADAAAGLLEYDGSGMSFVEMSHRSPRVMSVIEEATALLRELLGLTDDFDTAWMSGGASAQLAIAPMNLTNPRQTIAVVDTGYWATKAIKAALQICKVHVLAASKATHYDHIPKDWHLPKGVQYLHVASNETIDGTQHHDYPSVSVPIVADMTSDILTRPLPLERFGLIFASAQKNFGMAGTTCVIVRKNFLNRQQTRQVPTIFDYKTHIESQSLYHTPPTFAIFTALLMLRWTKAQGGLVEMARRNAEKAAVLYNEIDSNPLFIGSVGQEDRSLMNACFSMKNPDLENEFLRFAEQNGVVGIKGFPTVGGLRASLYNAMPLASVQYLVDLMRQFSAEKGK